MKTPCRACGSTEGKRPKKQHCDECLELLMWRNKQRSKAKKKLAQKPCAHCYGPKPRGRGLKLCDACRAKLDKPTMCRRCGERPIRRLHAKLCQPCFDTARAEKRERQRLAEQRRRAANIDQYRARARKNWHEMNADPERRARNLEARRIRYRLNERRKGREPREFKNGRKDVYAHVPGRPLAAAIYALADREASFKNPFAFATENGEGHLQAVYARAGILERVVMAWRRGEREARLNVAEDVLDRLGMFWWEVWTEETVRLPLFTVHVYTHQQKVAHGRRALRRIRVRSVPYGDAGPDTETLNRIEALMTGELVAA